MMRRNDRGGFTLPFWVYKFLYERGNPQTPVGSLCIGIMDNTKSFKFLRDKVPKDLILVFWADRKGYIRVLKDTLDEVGVVIKIGLSIDHGFEMVTGTKIDKPGFKDESPILLVCSAQN